MAANPRRLFREVLDETNDPLAALRAVREVVGLSVVEAKEVWLQVIGTAASLSAHQEKLAAAPLRIVCPRCRSDSTVVRKLHTLPAGLEYVEDEAPAVPAPRFVNGFWCSACQIGFVPNHLFDDLCLHTVRPI